MSEDFEKLHWNIILKKINLKLIELKKTTFKCTYFESLISRNYIDTNLNKTKNLINLKYGLKNYLIKINNNFNKILEICIEHKFNHTIFFNESILILNDLKKVDDFIDEKNTNNKKIYDYCLNKKVTKKRKFNEEQVIKQLGVLADYIGDLPI